MATKTVTASSDSSGQAQSKTAPSVGSTSKKKEKAAKAPTAPTPNAHHAKLVASRCEPRCAVGMLLDLVSKSLREQRTRDPEQAASMLGDDEEFGLTLDPLTLNIFGLRREKSISNRFDDLMVVIYQPAHFKDDGKTLVGDDLPEKNVADAQKFIQAIDDNDAGSDFDAPDEWPSPGKDIGCKICGHWKVLAFPITTDPGYEKKRETDDKFNDESDLPDGIGSIIPSIYPGKYQLGLHKGSREPPGSYPAFQLNDTLPARRRYPVKWAFDAARNAFDKAGAHKKKHKTDPDPADDPTVLAAKREAARKVLNGWVKGMLDNASEMEGKGRNRHEVYRPEELVALESPDGSERRNFESEKVQVTAIKVVDAPEDQPMQVGIEFVLGAEADPAAAPSNLLKHDDVVVLRKTIGGANIHMSVHSEHGAYRKGRTVDDWSEGCQVFRSPAEFHILLRLAQLYKRGTCGRRSAGCRRLVDAAVVKENMTGALTNYFHKRDKKSWTRDEKVKVQNWVQQAWESPGPVPEGISAADRQYIHERLSKVLESEAATFFNDAEYAQTLATKSVDVAEQRYWANVSPGTRVADAQIEFMDVEADFSSCLRQQFERWVGEMIEAAAPKMADAYNLDHFEVCDFGSCSTKFDYTLAQLSKDDLHGWIDKLGDRTWAELYPEDT